MTAIAWAALGIAAIAVAGLVGFGIAALSARKDAGTEGKERAVLAEQLKAVNAALTTQTARANFQERRANALDDAIAEHAADGGAAGANDRLLAQWRAARAADGGGPGVVPDAEDPGVETKTAGPDDLMRPGD